MNNSIKEGAVQKVSFTVVKSSVCGGEFDLPDYITYGLLCKDNLNGKEVFVKDISVNLQFVEKLKGVFDKEQPAIVHCFDVIEDFLATEY